MNIFDLLESPGMGRPHDTKGVQSAADQSAASPIGSGTTEREEKKEPVRMMGKNVKEAVDEAVVKPNFKMPPESLQDKMYRQHQELRKQRGAPSPEEYKERIAQKQKEIDALKEGILDRAAPKMPKPRNPADQVLRGKVNAAGKHLDKKRRQDLNPKHKHKDPLSEQLDEGAISNAIASAALAGSMALGGMAHAGEPVVGMGQSQNMQMAVDMAKMNAKVKYMKTVYGDNFQDKQMPDYHWGKVDLKPGKDGGYQATVPLIVDNEIQNESLRPGEYHHFETDPETGKRVYKGIRGQQTDAPRRAADDSAAERARSDQKAHIQHDRGLTEQDVDETIRKVGSQYRLISKKGKNLGTFDSKAGAEKHEREVQYFKHKNMEEGTYTVGFPDDEGTHTGNQPIVRLGGTFPARPKVKEGSLVKVDGLDGVWRVERIRGDAADVTMEIPNTAKSTRVPVEDCRVWNPKPVKEQEVDEEFRLGKKLGTRRDRFKSLRKRKEGILGEVGDKGISQSQENKFHVKLDKLVHDTFGHSSKEKGVAEGWKGKVAGAALAGAAALGGGHADAQQIDLPGPQVSYVAHVTAEANGREVHRTMNLGSNYDSEQEAYDDIERSLQSKGITRYNINIEQKYDQNYYPGSNQPRGGTATGRNYGTPGIGDMVINRIGREIRAGIPSKGGYATGGSNRGERPRDGSQWWRDQLPQMREGLKDPEDNPCWSGYKPVGTKTKAGKTVPNCVPTNEEIESHLYLMSRAGYDIVQEEWSDKYKRSINCSNPKGFSQKAHCAGRKKNEDVVEEKVRLDPKCWKGKKIGNPKTKMKGGVRVNNCVPK